MFKQITYTKNEATKWPIPNYWDAVALLIVCAVIIAFAWGAKQSLAPFYVGQVLPISLAPSHLPIYALRTVFRLFIALGFSLLFTFTFGTLAAKNKHAERLIIPIIDVLQSAPVFSFLAIATPVFIALFHGSMLGPECAAIFAVFIAQVWNMTLSFYQSVCAVPADLKEAAAIFRLSSWQKFWRIEVPFAMPGLLWNMMMSMSGSWFFVTVSEAFPLGNQSITLPGIGSYIAAALTQTDSLAFVYAIICMLVVIFLYDQILFRPLIYWAERFKGEQEEEGKTSFSLIIHLFQNTKLVRYSGIWLSYLGDWFINPPWCRVWRRKVKWQQRQKGQRLSKLLPLNKIENSSEKLIKAGKKGKAAIDQLERNYQKKNNFMVIYYIGLIAVFGVAIFVLVRFLIDVISFLGIAELKKVALLGLFTGLRVMVLVLVASLIWVPIGVWIGLRPSVAAKVRPLVQFLAAFPANLLFPVVAMFFLKYKLNVEIWVAPLMVLGTQWYILFNVIAGASVLPKDTKQVIAVLKVKGWLRWRRFLLPGIAPYFVTGAITAAAGAWNASVIAEVIVWHNVKLEATGLGAYITNNFTQNNTPQIVLGTITMCIFVLIINRLFWRPLYNLTVKKYTL